MLLVALALASAVYAGPPEVRPEALTLAEARERARAASPELEAAREDVAAARGEERQAGAFPNPSLVYAHEQTSRGGETNREDVALLEQPLEIAGQRGLREEAARLRREAAEARLRAAELELDLEVARAYAGAVAATRKAVHAREAAESFARAREILAERRERGDASGYEARRMALEAARYAARRARAELEQRSARAELASLLAASPAEARPLERPLELEVDRSPPPPAIERLRRVALEGHPEIRAAERSLRAQEVEAKLARRETVPDPTVGLGYKHERMAGSSGSWEGFAAQLSVPVPLWNRRGGAVSAARAEARGEAAALRRVRRRVALRLERAWSELRAASERVGALEPQLGPEADRALRAVRTAYREGEVALVEWLDAVGAYREALASYEELRADRLVQRAALERAAGRSLFEAER